MRYRIVMGILKKVLSYLNLMILKILKNGFKIF